jgi:uncharacterized protein YbaP (TraB family)
MNTLTRFPEHRRHPSAPARHSPRLLQRIAWTAVFALLAGLAPFASRASDCRPVALERTVPLPAGDFSRGLLWKIETPGTSPSYLFGTFHTSDPRITVLPCPVKAVFDQASSYTMELITNGAGIVSMAEAMFFDDGKTLKDVVGDALYKDTLKVIGISDPGKTRGINSMKPWAVMMTLSSPRQNSGLPLDLALQYQATRQGKPTYGLETMEEQIAVFNGMSLADQVTLLRDTVQTQKGAQDAMEELTQAYLDRNLAGLMALNEQFKPADTRVYDTLMDRLLVQRNRNMAGRMQKYLKQGNAFIAVGALHLPGDSGLLKLLSAGGHQVTRIY